MKRTVFNILLLFVISVNAQEYKVFHKSICYDLLSNFVNYEELIAHPFFENSLAKDTAFISDVKLINEKVRPSNICNFYASLPTDKDDIKACLTFFSSVQRHNIPDKWEGKYVDNIFSVLPQICTTIEKLINANYQKYWEKHVLPKLTQAIQDFEFEEGILDKIHNELILMAGNSQLSDEYSKIYILNIDNAFSLNDETFCCTYLLLDNQLSKKYRIDFIQVYIHENLHRLYLSKDLMKNLEDLFEKDVFYKTKESIARKHGEGLNEAFIVALECYVSRKLTLKSDKDVYDEFKEYVEGSLVLAPVIYKNLFQKSENETLDNFLLTLFKKKKIKAGKVEKQYNSAMEWILKAN